MSIKTSVALLTLTFLGLLAACAGPRSAATEASIPTPSALTGEWTILSIQGSPVVEDSPAFLGFGEDGRLFGHSSVNQLFGSWALDAGTLELGQLGSTKMAGPPALMEQETQFLAALARASRAMLAEDGCLVLSASDSAVLLTAAPRAPKAH
ncbi:MAG: META domain-containing protein [Planctomycetota bacterium]|nr:META domain-containing protein [Planctomycetota bacterium]